MARRRARLAAGNRLPDTHEWCDGDRAYDRLLPARADRRFLCPICRQPAPGKVRQTGTEMGDVVVTTLGPHLRRKRG